MVGLSHRTAAVETRERLAVPSDALANEVKALRTMTAVREVVVLATCNRVEVYAAGDDIHALSTAVRGYLQGRGAPTEALYEHRDDAAVRHAFRVCASLDSLVVGEPQVLGQVKEAVGVARSAGGVGAVLGRLMERAFRSAKRVRTETGIAEGQVSVASVAVDLARGIFGELQGRRVLVLGAGKMALGAARSLVRLGAVLAVANRSYERAVELATAHRGSAHPLTDLGLLLPSSDVVVASTAATRFVLTREEVAAAMKQRRGRSLFLVDITVPRNIDPRAGDLDNVYLYNVDDLEKIVAEGQMGRGASTTAAEAVVDEELRGFTAEGRAMTGVVPTIAALRQRCRATALAELERSLSGRLKHLGDDDRKALEAMVEATVNKLLHAPTMALRQKGESNGGSALVASARVLFGMDDDGGISEAPEVTGVRAKGKESEG